MQQMSTESLTNQLLSTWAKLRAQGRRVFMGGFIVVAIGISCEAIVVLSLLFWGKLSHLSQAQLSVVVAVDLVVALVVAPIIGLFMGRRFWTAMERRFESIMPANSSRIITIEHERLTP